MPRSLLGDNQLRVTTSRTSDPAEAAVGLAERPPGGAEREAPERWYDAFLLGTSGGFAAVLRFCFALAKRCFFGGAKGRRPGLLFFLFFGDLPLFSLVFSDRQRGLFRCRFAEPGRDFGPVGFGGVWASARARTGRGSGNVRMLLRRNATPSEFCASTLNQ